MMGHNLIFMQNGRWKTLRKRQPFCFQQFSGRIEDHFFVVDMPEAINAVLANKGDKIKAIAGIVVSSQTNGAPMMPAWIIITHTVGNDKRSLKYGSARKDRAVFIFLQWATPTQQNACSLRLYPYRYTFLFHNSVFAVLTNHLSCVLLF